MSKKSKINPPMAAPRSKTLRDLHRQFPRTIKQWKAHWLQRLPHLSEDPAAWEALARRSLAEAKFIGWAATRELLISPTSDVGEEYSYMANNLILRMPDLLSFLFRGERDHFAATMNMLDRLLAIWSRDDLRASATFDLSAEAFEERYAPISLELRKIIDRIFGAGLAPKDFESLRSHATKYILLWLHIYSFSLIDVPKAPTPLRSAIAYFGSAEYHSGRIHGRIDAMDDAESDKRSKVEKAVNARHTVNRKKRENILGWYVAQSDSYKRLGKNHAALEASKLFGVAFKTARNHLISA